MRRFLTRVTQKITNAWPVGSIFLSTVSTNPAQLLGFGTWAAFGAGRVLVGLDAGQTEFDTVEETGGAKTVALATGEMPVHGHGVNDPGHTHNVEVGGASASTGIATGNATSQEARVLANTTGISIQNAGSGQAHNNLQPYIVCYFWKRTA